MPSNGYSVAGAAAGWAALAVAVAAAVIVVPPLVMPKYPPQSGALAVSAAPSSSPSSFALPSPPSLPAASRTPVAKPPRAEPSGVERSSVEPSRAVPTRSASGQAFPAIQVHAADPANIREGARIIECASCAGGQRVGYIGGPNILAIPLSGVRAAGTRTLTITYETERPRTLMISVSGGPVRELTLSGAGSWLIPATVSVQLFIPAGTSWIKFFNSAGDAPDINQIAVS